MHIQSNESRILDIIGDISLYLSKKEYDALKLNKKKENQYAVEKYKKLLLKLQRLLVEATNEFSSNPKLWEKSSLT